jgi:cell division septum initiation protein DivIVA
VYEEQRARAAKAAADFETTLAGRRKAAEDEFMQKMAESQARLDEAIQLADRTRTEADEARAQATREAARLVEEARQEAAHIVGDAKSTAERVRADSDRELTAATQRRDSINAQLANVRQMLATLTGTAQMPLSAFGAEDDDPADAADDPASDVEVADQAEGAEDGDPAEGDPDQAETDPDVGTDEGGTDQSESEEDREGSLADSKG